MPETNVLDLGVWMALQSAVEKRHHGRRCQAEALNATAVEVWGEVTNEEAFQKVFGKLWTVYYNIRAALGGNDLVESNRGKAGVAAIAAEDEDNEPLFQWEVQDEVMDDADEGENDIANII